MNIRKFNKEKDYETVLSWATKRNLKYPPLDFLSDDGLIIDNVCSVFLYKTNSKVLFLEALISNPNTTKELRSQGLDILFSNIIDYSKANSIKYIYCNLENKILENKIKRFNVYISEKPSFIGLGVL